MQVASHQQGPFLIRRRYVCLRLASGVIIAVCTPTIWKLYQTGNYSLLRRGIKEQDGVCVHTLVTAQVHYRSTLAPSLNDNGNGKDVSDAARLPTLNFSRQETLFHLDALNIASSYSSQGPRPVSCARLFMHLAHRPIPHTTRTKFSLSTSGVWMFRWQLL